MESLSGKVVAGRYKVLERLGEGGIGRVYRAEQIGLDRICALKVIRPDRKSDAITAERFVREARAAGRIRSPHVVTLYDAGRDGEELYIAMELLLGQSLRQRLHKPPALGIPNAVEVAEAIARGLEAAHEAGVLHRDLKPANVFLCADGTVKVLDFGIAKIVDDEPAKPLTDARRVLGTPVYMSPEQARKKAVGPPADLYALGVMLYEMLVGSPPFRTGSAKRTMEAHARTPAPRVGKAAPWLLVPDDLEALVARLLEKDPTARPATAREVGDELERIRARLGGELTVMNEVPSSEDEATEVWASNPWAEEIDAAAVADAVTIRAGRRWQAAAVPRTRGPSPAVLPPTRGPHPAARPTELTTEKDPPISSAEMLVRPLGRWPLWLTLLVASAIGGGLFVLIVALRQGLR